MTKINKKVLIIIIAAITVAALVSVSFAWFIQGIMSKKFEFTVAYVETSFAVMRGEDYNRDGVLDLDPYGVEAYMSLGDSFQGTVILNEDGSPKLDGSGKLQYDNSATKPNIRFDMRKIMPTQIYTWKMQVQNVGDVKGIIGANFHIPLGTPATQDKIRVLSVSAINVTDPAKPVTTTTLFDTANVHSTATDQVVTVMDGVVLNPYVPKPGESTSLQPNTYCEIIIQVKFETIEALRRANVAITDAEYQAFMLKSYQNITLEVLIEEAVKAR